MKELSQEELMQVEGAGLTIEELAKHWDMFPELSFEAAVGGAVMLKNGQGQERNEPFTTEGEQTT